MPDSTLSASAVQTIARDCLYTDDELKGYVRAAFEAGAGGVAIKYPEGAMVVEGIVRNFVFHPERLKVHKAEIGQLLNDLPGTFKEGWSFLQMCEDKYGQQWTGLHTIMEELMVLGIAVGMVEYCAPRDMWPALPGGVPYLRIKEE